MEEKEAEVNKVKENKRNLFSWLLLILAYSFLFVMIVLIVFVIKYKDIVSIDPLNYGMKGHNFASCQCLDFNGKTWYSLNSSGFIHTEGNNINPVTEFLKNITFSNSTK